MTWRYLSRYGSCGMMCAMSTALEWIAAIGAVIAAAGGLAGWLALARARLQLRTETIRNSRERQENEFHRKRFTKVWDWWHEQPEGETFVKAAQWYSEWTGAAKPFHGGKDGGFTPGFGSADASEAYERYIDYLAAIYQPMIKLAPAHPGDRTWFVIPAPPWRK
jgi:hypothetical protein